MWIVDDAFNLAGYAWLPLLGLPVAVALLRWLRSRRALLAACGPIVLWAVFMAGSRLTLVQVSTCDVPALRVVNANVLQTNERLPELADAVLAQHPDVVVFEELAVDITSVSPAFGAAYPYRLTTEVPWVTLASRLPLEQPRRLALPQRFAGYAPLLAEVQVAGRTVHIVGVHVAAPLGSGAYETHQSQYAIALDQVRDKSPVVLIGDLNATPTSPTFLRFLFQSGLRSASEGLTQLPTYTVRGPFAMRIDHALVKGLDVCSVQVFSLPGSDHRGIVVDLQLPGD